MKQSFKNPQKKGKIFISYPTFKTTIELNEVKIINIKELNNDNGVYLDCYIPTNINKESITINIIKKSSKPNKIIITDSAYAIKCATTYGSKLEKKGWKQKKDDEEIPNLDLVKRLYELTNKYDIQYKHVLAHTGNKDRHSIGNYYADLLANKAINAGAIPKKPSNPRIYLKVPYAKKDEAKAKGARWDAEKKSWYIFEDNSNKSYLLSNFQ